MISGREMDNTGSAGPAQASGVLRERTGSRPRVALVFPEVKYPSGQPPLGIGYLAGWLGKQTEARVEIIDLSFARDPFAMLEQRLRKHRYDAVGLSVVTPHLREARRAAALARQTNPDCQVIFGGPHPTVLPGSVLEDPNVDTVCIGEGEETLAQLLEAGGPVESIPGIAFRGGKTGADGALEVVRTPRRPFTLDLDSVPPPARHLFEMEQYFSSWYSMDSWKPGLRGTSVIASRGCPYTCTFCQPTISSIFGKRIRKRSPGPVVDEIEEIRERFGIEAFMFEDSLFILDRKWVAGICGLLIERRLGLHWCCNIRADLAEREQLLLMKEAGLRKVNIGVESAVPRVLEEIYDKRETVESVERAVHLAKSVGLRVQGYFMMGAYSETAEEIEATVRFAERLPFDDAVFDITTPFPHTTLYDRTRKHIDKPFEDFDCFHVSVYADGDEGLTGEQIERLKKRAYYRFYLKPRRAARLAGQLLTPTGLRRTLLKLRRV